MLITLSAIFSAACICCLSAAQALVLLNLRKLGSSLLRYSKNFFLVDSSLSSDIMTLWE